jgi:peptidoglycan biosynthesis protein MviN/MurJ (putative lipid II flippase)
MLPVKTPSPVLLFSGLLTGMMLDAFMDTSGMHALATVALAYCRIFYLKYTLSKEQMETLKQPDIAGTSIQWFLVYAVLMTLLHHTILFFAEAFTFIEFISTLYRVLLSAFVTIVIIMAIHLLFYRVRS